MVSVRNKKVANTIPYCQKKTTKNVKKIPKNNRKIDEEKPLVVKRIKIVPKIENLNDFPPGKKDKNIVILTLLSNSNKITI